MTSSVIDAPDMTGLIELSRDPGLDLKPVILRVQTDLFLAAPIRDRAVLSAFASLATGLIPIVDDETALTVARKLAPCPETPQTVLAALAARGGAVCETVIDAAAVVGPTVVASAISSGSDIGHAIAARAERERRNAPDPEVTDLALARDSHARLDRATLDRLTIRARRETELAETLLGRRDIAAADLAPLWLHAEVPLRKKIHDSIAATAALRFHPQAPRDIGTVLTGLSRGGDVKGFLAALADALGLPNGFLGSAPNPSSRYDLLTLALRAADLSEAQAVYVFLTLNGTVARSADRVFELVQLFRSLTRPAARDLLGAILDVKLPERGSGAEHRPYYAPDTAKPRQQAERISSRNIILPSRARQTV
ncbi:hypothetical protein [Methylobacterium haplocladii]|uniref:DUF2336 domain-containing protein n=1 Tax=Methylobacterium haplocladii TaxID=1176176 RepID=A0A512IUI9_9HYPH|nr:hypothetical protein [Methylobacterium haplocladii]GEP01370.1 hypothetical protein MHA02_37570 [Methylobacterium haplocladii]GJD83828.1 hypothetical protein HPGCJGGD_1701 [Methylobacterium haplocladii]GLS58261.1 hypothetical protein GCM10007887_09190 [Methylobacterium haplocladii]